jgi:hypothetical protein
MRPDGANAIEAEREVEKKKDAWIHDPKYRSLALSHLDA